MRKPKVQLFAAALLLLRLSLAAVPAAGSPGTTSISDLLEKGLHYHGQEVRVVGEAIGDLMVRGSHGWVNISDGSGALGIFAPSEMLEPIGVLGRYNATGDLLAVRGVFLYACPEHSGGVHLHAGEITVVTPGRKFTERVSPEKAVIAAMFCLMAVFSFVLRRRLRLTGPVVPGEELYPGRERSP